MLLPHNNDVTKPRALSTFLDELAELGFDKGLIKNKNLLSDLIEKEKSYRNAEDTSDNESNNEESSSDIENQEEQVEEEEEEEVASENSSEAEGTQESENDSENDSQETERSSQEKSTTFHSENPCEHCENSNVYGTLIMKCPKCFWHDYYKICPICDHQIPEERNYIKEGFLRCHDCGAIIHKTRRRWKPISLPLLKRRTRKRNIYFHSFQMAVYFSLFAIVFLNKVFKTVSLVWFYCLRLLVACFN